MIGSKTKITKQHCFVYRHYYDNNNNTWNSVKERSKQHTYKKAPYSVANIDIKSGTHAQCTVTTGIL